MLNSLRTSLIKSNCYLFWCLTQILVIIGIIGFLFVSVEKRIDKHFILNMEIILYLIMIFDFFLYLFIYQFRLTFIIVIEIFLISVLSAILFIIYLEIISFWLEEYEFTFMIMRTVIQLIRFILLIIKTKRGNQQRELLNKNFNIESGNQPNVSHQDQIKSKFYLYLTGRFRFNRNYLDSFP